MLDEELVHPVLEQVEAGLGQVLLEELVALELVLVQVQVRFCPSDYYLVSWQF